MSHSQMQENQVSGSQGSGNPVPENHTQEGQQKPLNGRVLVSDCLGRQEFNTQLLYFTCSSLAENDEHIYLISDRGGSPNVVCRDMFTGQETTLTDNKKGILKSYVYFDGTFNEGLGKASVCLDYKREIIYYIQDDKI